LFSALAGCPSRVMRLIGTSIAMVLMFQGGAARRNTCDLLTAREPADTHGLVMPPRGARSEDAAVLIARIARGDREAFGRLYDALAGAVFGLIRRVLRDPGASGDVLQEVFWQVWREASRYDPGRASPEAWLLMRAKSRAIDRLAGVAEDRGLVERGGSLPSNGR
jgi:hypothetical protein